MSDQTDASEEDTKRLVVAMTDFLRDQLIIRTDLVPEERDSLQIAIECLQQAYNLESNAYIQQRNSRSLMDIFCQVTNPVSVKDKIQAEAHKEEGNIYMRRRMFENAEAEYTNAIELDKWNAIYYCNRASARIEQRNFFNAIADCRQAMTLNPDYAKAHARMGQSYALLHRPREAARCFRKALELDPENEKYRNNLSVAENEIERPDISQFITSLLGSLLGTGSENAEDRNLRLPHSFMIITENHPPIPAASSQINESTRNSERSQISQSPLLNRIGHESSMNASNGISNITFPNLFGIIDEGSEEQPLLQFDSPISNESTENGDDDELEEFMIEIPLLELGIFRVTPSSETEDSLHDAEDESKTTDEMSQNNLPGKESLPEKDKAETKSNGLENENVMQSNVSEKIMSDMTTREDTILHNESQFSDKQNNSQSKKYPAQASTDEVKYTNNDEDKKPQNAFISEKDKKQNNVTDKDTLPPHETGEKSSDQENTNMTHNSFQEKIMSDTSNKEDAVLHDENQLSDKQNKNQSEKPPAESNISEMKDPDNDEN